MYFHNYKYPCVLKDITYHPALQYSVRLTHINPYLTCLYFSGTFGVESVVITDTTGGRACLVCSFYSFSTDTGCTVELVSSDSSVQYIETINRSGNSIAEGCVSDVTAGEYVVRVYDQSSSELVHEVDNVTVSMLQVLPTATIMSFSSASLRTTVSSPSKGSQN